VTLLARHGAHSGPCSLAAPRQAPRLLASVIKVMRLNLHASVIAITRDINFSEQVRIRSRAVRQPEDLGIGERP
jgi:hypothetical protein